MEEIARGGRQGRRPPPRATDPAAEHPPGLRRRVPRSRLARQPAHPGLVPGRRGVRARRRFRLDEVNRDDRRSAGTTAERQPLTPAPLALSRQPLRCANARHRPAAGPRLPRRDFHPPGPRPDRRFAGSAAARGVLRGARGGGAATSASARGAGPAGLHVRLGHARCPGAAPSGSIAGGRGGAAGARSPGDPRSIPCFGRPLPACRRAYASSRVEEPGTLEGGDVVIFGDRIAIGLSARTDGRGARSARRGRAVARVPAVPLPCGGSASSRHGRHGGGAGHAHRHGRGLRLTRRGRPRDGAVRARSAACCCPTRNFPGPTSLRSAATRSSPRVTRPLLGSCAKPD